MARFSIFRKYYFLLLIPAALLLAFKCKNNLLFKSETYTEPKIISNESNTTPFSNMLGVNGFEWNLLQSPVDPNNTMEVYQPKMELVKSFTGFRHYLDWGRIEGAKGKYTFSPAHSGGWNYDEMYRRLKAENIEVLADLKTVPDWLLQSYPQNERDAEDVPMPYNSDKKQPASYVLQAKAAFQFAARYGSNKSVDTMLVTVDPSSRWNNDPANHVKIGMALIKYIECDNERDKWWKGDKARQTAEEYAANLSAFYDGDKGKLGKGVGVKAADPNMIVVMGGLASTDPKYVAQMIDWCKIHRGYKPDGSVNLCFDVINYHLYSNDHKQHSNDQGTRGVAPELSEAGQVADAFVALGKQNHLDVWVTEAGYDVNQQSPQRAIKIGAKNEYLTQGDWIIRTSLLYARHGIKKLFFYELFDDNIKNATQYASSGLVTENLKRRPAADYILQTKNLLGSYIYKKTIDNQPLVDLYRRQNKTMFVLTVPDETGKVINYSLQLPGAHHVIIHNLQAGAAQTTSETKAVANGRISLKVTETPVFVEVAD